MARKRARHLGAEPVAGIEHGDVAVAEARQHVIGDDEGDRGHDGKHDAPHRGDARDGDAVERAAR